MAIETAAISGQRRLPLLTTASSTTLAHRVSRVEGRHNFSNPTRPSSMALNQTMPARIQMSSAMLITPDQIPIASELIDGHWLASYITKPDPISTVDLTEILKTIENTINITFYESGGIPASTNQASEYRDGSWRRDDAIMAIAMLLAANLETERSGDRQELIQRAKQELIAMAKYDNTPFHRGQFTSFLFLNNRGLAKEKFRTDIQGLPRAKYSIDANGALGEYYDWGHHQLDGLGTSLFAYFHAANQGFIELKDIDKVLTEQNPENGADSLFSVALHFLHEIEYWDQIDVGPWESFPAHKRASSVGICLAAFKEAKKYFDDRGWELEKTITVNSNVNLKQILEEGIRNGEAVINERIPSDGKLAVETDQIPSDSALALLLLLNPGLNEAQENAILQRVYENIGEYGIRRMGDEIDAFMGENYALNPNGRGKWSVIYPGHKAAQWTLFDPILATHYYRKFIKSGGNDENSFNLADKHFKRTLSQITKHDYQIEQFINPLEKRTVEIPAGILPEARWKRKDEHGETWLPNTNSPLQMAHGVFAIMMAEATRAIELKESGAEHALAA